MMYIPKVQIKLIIKTICECNGIIMKEAFDLLNNKGLFPNNSSQSILSYNSSRNTKIELNTKKINTDFEFYKQSLIDAENEIVSIYKRGKALKDVVGKEYETHRKRLWKHFGFDVTKHRHEAQFAVDWAIEYEGKLIALEEDKGHYADSCMHLRTFSEFAKTINNYNKKNKDIPVLILCSFTRYSKHEEKFEELKETWKTEISMHINKMHYTTLTYCDRINKKDWVGNKQTTRTNSYSHFAEDALILEDIEFIKSLIPVSE